MAGYDARIETAAPKDDRSAMVAACPATRRPLRPRRCTSPPPVAALQWPARSLCPSHRPIQMMTIRAEPLIPRGADGVGSGPTAAVDLSLRRARHAWTSRRACAIARSHMGEGGGIIGPAAPFLSPVVTTKRAPRLSAYASGSNAPCRRSREIVLATGARRPYSFADPVASPWVALQPRAGVPRSASIEP
jgi:hypothetical protein